MAFRLGIFCSLLIFCVAEPTWTTMRVTWGRNIFSSNNFVKMPLTVGDTADKGFVKISESCKDGKFFGHRYMKDNDPAVILLYDSKGYIAGMQTGIPTYYISQMKTTYPYSKIPSFQLEKIVDEDIYFLTVYFMEPSKICQSDRKHEEFEKNIGSGLWFQTGPDPAQNLLTAPLYEKDAEDEWWTKGKCFPSMGVHYRPKTGNTSEIINCDNFLPFFAMYNRGKITGFGFALIGNFQFTKRYEHPSKSSLPMFADPVPDCINEEADKSGGITTFRIFFTVNPWNLFC